MGIAVGYTTLDDLESRLDNAVELGIIEEAEARREYEEAMAEELERRAERDYEKFYNDDDFDPHLIF